jgi:predicted ester cyclase
MSTKQNKAVILKFYDLYNRQEIDAAYELFAPGYILHSPMGDLSREQCKQFDTTSFIGFPDLVCSVVDIIAEGDKVAFRVSAKGTHTGPFMGAAPTGKKFEMNNTWIVKVSHNRWVEQWGTSEIPNMMQQLGIVPKQ